MVGLRAALCLLVLLLAGCTSFDADINGNGTTTATERTTESCSDGTGNVRVSTNGAGSVTITVTDGAGKPIYTKNISGSGQNHDDQALSGAPGTWTMTAKFGGSNAADFGSGFTGQWSLGLSC